MTSCQDGSFLFYSPKEYPVQRVFSSSVGDSLSYFEPTPSEIKIFADKNRSCGKINCRSMSSLCQPFIGKSKSYNGRVEFEIFAILSQRCHIKVTSRWRKANSSCSIAILRSHCIMWKRLAKATEVSSHNGIRKDD